MGASLGNIIIHNSELVKKVIVSVGGHQINTLDALFVDLSKPLPLFTELADYLSGTDGSFPRPEWHMVRVDFITYDEVTKVEWQATIYKHEKPEEQRNDMCEGPVVLNRYFEIAAKNNSQTEYRLSFSNPTLGLSVVFTEGATIGSVTLRVSTPGPNIDLPLQEKDGRWIHYFPLDHRLPLSHQLPNFDKMDVSLVVNGSEYTDMTIEQKYVNLLRSRSGMVGLAYL